MDKNAQIGIDLGGTNIRAGLVSNGILSQVTSKRINAQGSEEEVLEELFSLTGQLFNNAVTSIGIGVPGLVDAEQGIVFDVVNIPSWKEVRLQKRMEERFQVPVLINNDANCFALGEFRFGKGKGYTSMVGLTIGTGLGTGIIINQELYNGNNCGAGEFGMVDYLDHCYEYYASGQFFRNVYGIDGETVYQQAQTNDPKALGMYAEMGAHLGNAIKMILYALDPGLIVLGGSVRHAFPYFQKTMWQQVETFAYKKALQQLKIEVSTLENSGILGASALNTPKSA